MCDTWGKLAFLLAFVLCSLDITTSGEAATPQPPIWPEKFHALLTQNTSGDLAVVDLWYDFPGGRNLNIIQRQGSELDGPLWDNERQNGSTYYYTPATGDCNVIDMGVGVLRPEWLSEATYLGEEDIGIYSCYKWENGDIPVEGDGEDQDPTSFVTYWSEKGTQRPVKWIFFTGMSMEVIRFEPGAELEDSQWQLPAYCFPESASTNTLDIIGSADGDMNRLSSSVSGPEETLAGLSIHRRGIRG